MSKLIPDCFSFGLPRSAIGPKKWRQLFNQIAAEVEPITNRLIAYSRASGSLLDFALSSHWLLMIFFFVVIGCWDYFGSGFPTLNWKVLSHCQAVSIFIHQLLGEFWSVTCGWLSRRNQIKSALVRKDNMTPFANMIGYQLANVDSKRKMLSSCV